MRGRATASHVLRLALAWLVVAAGGGRRCSNALPGAGHGDVRAQPGEGAREWTERERAVSERGPGELGRSVGGVGARQSGRTRGNGARQWRGASSAWLPRAPPLGHSTERLAGVGAGRLDHVIGLVLVQTKSWALKQVCCPHDDLQISLTDHGHLSNGLAVN